MASRGRRGWPSRTVRSRRGKRLLRKRGELLEGAFTHYRDAGGMRRTHLRGHPNILKRLVVHVAGFNLGLVMRKLVGRGTPRALAAALRCLFARLAEACGVLARRPSGPAPGRALPAAA